jgi:ankyrin repeat protein
MTTPTAASLDNQPLIDDLTASDNDPVVFPITQNLGGLEAWERVFAEPFDKASALASFDVLAASINERPLEGHKTPLSRAAETATGARMEFITKVFEKAVEAQTYKKFPDGSLGKMAVQAGNPEGAVTAARTAPQLHTLMRDSNEVPLIVQVMMQGDLELLNQLTTRINDAPLIDPYYTNKQGFSYLISYLKKCPEPRLDVIEGFSKCLLNARNLHDSSATFYQRYLTTSDMYGKTALHALALRMADNRIDDQVFIDVFSWYSEQVDINTPDSNEETVLHIASKYNRPHVNIALLKMGALLDWVTHSGRTALNIAAYHGQVALVKAYLEYDVVAANVDPSLKKAAADGPRPRLPLHAARNNHWGTLIEYLKHSSEGINQHEETSDRHTPLILAVKSVDHGAVAALIKAGVKINETNGHGYTAVHYAAHNFNGVLGDAPQKILFDLLANGGSLEISDIDGRTPLDIIIARSDIDSSQELFYTINTSLLSEWVFQGDREKTELFLEQGEAMSHTTQGVLRDTHPLVARAEKWMKQHDASSNKEIKEKIKQAKSDLCGILVDTLSYSAVVLSVADVDVNTTVKNIYEAVPEQYRLPVLGSVGFVMALARATEFRGDLQKFRNIGFAADAMAGKISRNLLKPVTSALSKCITGESGPLKHAYRYFKGLRDSCRKISTACKVFVRVLRRGNLNQASPSELVGHLDEEMLAAVAKMTHQDFQRFRGQARLNARHGHQEHDTLNR